MMAGSQFKLPNYLARNGWRTSHFAIAIGLMALGVAATWEGWMEIYTYAIRDQEASHVWLVPVVFVWLFWVRRGRMRFCKPTPSLIGPVFVTLGGIGIWFGTRWGYYAALHTGSVMVVLGCALAVFGKDVFFRFFPAFAVLIFLIPTPGSIRQPIAHPMMTLTASATETIFDVLHMEVERRTNVLIINGNTVAVAEACNGMRMVFTLIMVSFVIAFGTPLKGFVRFLILTFALPTALICNLIRMVPTVWVFGLDEESSTLCQMLLAVEGFAVQYLGMAPYEGASRAATFFHDIAGWVMIFVAFLLLLGIIGALRWAMVPVRQYNLAYD